MKIPNKEPDGFSDRLNQSINLIKKAEPLALSLSDKGFFLAFSGGKDSQCLYHVAKLAGVRFEPHYSLTTVDPPELVHFIKAQYPDVIIDRPPMTFYQLCVKKKALPRAKERFCCNVLKEQGGAGLVTLTGVRKEESRNRAKRVEIETASDKKKRRKQHDMAFLDQFNRTQEHDPVQCLQGKDKLVINPIIEWSEDDVWWFLSKVVCVPHCSLYDRGYKRLGCLFCPMASKAELRTMIHDYPKYKDAYVRMIQRLLDQGYCSKYPMTATQVFDWWCSKRSVQNYYYRFINQLQIQFK